MAKYIVAGRKRGTKQGFRAKQSFRTLTAAKNYLNKRLKHPKARVPKGNYLVGVARVDKHSPFGYKPVFIKRFTKR